MIVALHSSSLLSRVSRRGLSLSHDDDDDDDDDDEPPLGRCREESAASLRMPFSKRLFVPKHDNVESEGKSTTTACKQRPPPRFSTKMRPQSAGLRVAPRLAQSVVVFVWNDWKKRGKKKRSVVRPSRTNTRFSIETYVRVLQRARMDDLVVVFFCVYTSTRAFLCT